MRPTPIVLGGQKRPGDSPDRGAPADAPSYPPADGSGAHGNHHRKRVRLPGYGSDPDDTHRVWAAAGKIFSSSTPCSDEDEQAMDLLVRLWSPSSNAEPTSDNENLMQVAANVGTSPSTTSPNPEDMLAMNTGAAELAPIATVAELARSMPPSRLQHLPVAHAWPLPPHLQPSARMAWPTLSYGLPRKPLHPPAAHAHAYHELGSPAHMPLSYFAAPPPRTAQPQQPPRARSSSKPPRPTASQPRPPPPPHQAYQHHHTAAYAPAEEAPDAAALTAAALTAAPSPPAVAPASTGRPSMQWHPLIEAGPTPERKTSPVAKDDRRAPPPPSATYTHTHGTAGGGPRLLDWTTQQQTTLPAPQPSACSEPHAVFEAALAPANAPAAAALLHPAEAMRAEELTDLTLYPLKPELHPGTMPSRLPSQPPSRGEEKYVRSSDSSSPEDETPAHELLDHAPLLPLAATSLGMAPAPALPLAPVPESGPFVMPPGSAMGGNARFGSGPGGMTFSMGLGGGSGRNLAERKEWTVEEDRQICKSVRKHGFKWRLVAADVPGRSDDAVRNRYNRVKDLPHLQPSAEELAEEQHEWAMLVTKPSARRPRGGGSRSGQQHGEAHTAKPRAAKAAASREMDASSKESSKESSSHSSDEDSKEKVERVSWSRSEDETIVRSVHELGNKWAKIAERLSGRTEHAIRNRYARLQSLASRGNPIVLSSGAGLPIGIQLVPMS